MTVENIFLLSPYKNGTHSGNGQTNNGTNGDSIAYIAGLKVYAAYPDEATVFAADPDIIGKISAVHSKSLEKNVSAEMFTDDFLQSNIKALTFGELNVLTLLLPDNHILGLVIGEKANPYDYRNELVRLCLEYFLQKFAENHKGKAVTTLLLTLFVDLRKYDDELATAQQVQPQVLVVGNTPMIKAFLYGIDNAGKSSLMRFLATNKYDANYFPPTKKFRITNIKLKSGAKLVAWDMPGQRIFRADWLRGAQSSNIVIFMLDLADKTRFEESHQALWSMLDLFELKGIPLLFLANKTDLVETLPDVKQLIAEFKLNELKDRSWHILFTSIAKNEGIAEAVQWIEDQVDELLLKQGITITSPSL